MRVSILDFNFCLIKDCSKEFVIIFNQCTVNQFLLIVRTNVYPVALTIFSISYCFKSTNSFFRRFIEVTSNGVVEKAVIPECLRGAV